MPRYLGGVGGQEGNLVDSREQYSIEDAKQFSCSKCGQLLMGISTFMGSTHEMDEKTQSFFCRTIGQYYIYSSRNYSLEKKIVNTNAWKIRVGFWGVQVPNSNYPAVSQVILLSFTAC